MLFLERNADIGKHAIFDTMQFLLYFSGEETGSKIQFACHNSHCITCSM